jgi:alanine-synthesizing transaminase
MFARARLPLGLEHMGSMEFSKAMVERAGVAVAPGIGFGEYGEGFVRIALVENEQRIRQAARAVKKYLSEARAAAPIRAAE